MTKDSAPKSREISNDLPVQISSGSFLCVSPFTYKRQEQKPGKQDSHSANERKTGLLARLLKS